MTTKTQPTATDQHEKLIAAHEDAKGELKEVNQRAHEYRGKVQALREQLLGRQIDHKPEFAQQTGQPKPKTEAATLAAEIAKLTEDDNFEGLIHGAEQRLERARLELRRHVEHGARTLLAELLPEAEDAVASFAEWASQGPQHLQRLSEVSHRASGICTQSRAFDPRTIPDLDHWTVTVRGLTTGEPPLPLPRELLAELEAADE